MSINSAMLAGASGMRANSSALAAISDNIANVNTVGFKRTRNDFSSLLAAQAGSSAYNAGGVMARQSALMTEQGSLQGSSIATHLAVAGDGFFVVRPRGDDATALDPYLYSRAGQFAPDVDGFLKNVSGFFLQGWPVDAVTGGVTTNPTDLSALEPVRVTGITGEARASATVGVSANLDSSQAVSAAAATYNAAASANNMASGAVTPDFETSIEVYDARGGLHTLTLSFLKRAANSWYAEARLPAAEIVPGGGLIDGQVARGIVAFTPTGQVDTAATTLPTSFTIAAAAGAGPSWLTSLGLPDQTISLDFGGPSSASGLTQFDSPSVLVSTDVDGAAYGSLASVEVDDTGFVTAVFTNALSRRIYQIPIATFANPGGLTADIGGVYRISSEAGIPNMRGAGVAGAGRIQPRALESSTVDLAEEFSNLIVTQRAYSASSKIITTADEMLDELIRLKR
jgi:flagellar hook protein FlgE